VPLWTETACRFPPKPPAGLNRNRLSETPKFAIRAQGGKALVPPGEILTVPQYQKSKGSLIMTAALELSQNQITHFYSPRKDTGEMLRMLAKLIQEYKQKSRIYLSWDAASWHISKMLLGPR
jgi:hypothetical protein